MGSLPRWFAYAPGNLSIGDLIIVFFLCSGGRGGRGGDGRMTSNSLDNEIVGWCAPPACGLSSSYIILILFKC